MQVIEYLHGITKLNRQSFNLPNKEKKSLYTGHNFLTLDSDKCCIDFLPWSYTTSLELRCSTSTLHNRNIRAT